MATVSHQNGSSSTLGLLTASSIFVGILAYATYYGFDEGSVPKFFTANTEDVSVEPTQVVQPGEKGIFASPTLVEADEPVSEPSVNQTSAPVVVADSNNKQAEASPMENESVLNRESLSFLSDDTQIKAFPPVTRTVVSMPSYSGYPADDQWMGYMDHRNASTLDGRGYYDGRGYGNGSGRGRGTLDGDGSFDFNVSFKGRARMDADSDFDGNTDFNGYSNYQNNHSYYHQPTMYTQYYHYR
jgi:hypothetical protein